MSTHPQGSRAQLTRWRLPQHDEELLRNALKMSGTARAVTAEQRAIIRQICSSPENRAFAPEDFVIAFKLALTNTANEVGIRPSPDRNELLSRFVSICIEEFFRSPSTDDTLSGGGGSKVSTAQEIAPESR